ncbi:MAG: preprotein translocase subunit SecE [Oscillospiraceae bacterium]|nr:preprotein translocase subunit SecE [Oscillospiraceae bacterium]
MAKDLDTVKNSPDDEEKKADAKSKGDKGSKDKSGKPKKKKKGIVKFFKDAKSEFKKVVWPTPKETTRNTIVVLMMCLVAAVVIFGLDSLFGLLNKLAFH